MAHRGIEEMTGEEEAIRHRAEVREGDWGWLKAVNFLLSIIDMLRQAEEKRMIAERKVKRKGRDRP